MHISLPTFSWIPSDGIFFHNLSFYDDFSYSFAIFNAGLSKENCIFKLLDYPTSLLNPYFCTK